MFVVVHSEQQAAAAVILSNPDQSLLLCVWWRELSLRPPSLSPRLIPAERTSRPIRSTSVFTVLGPPAAYLLPFLVTEPSPSKSIQVTRCRIIPQPLRHAALVRLILLSGFTLPGAAKTASATKHQTFNEPVKNLFQTLAWIFVSLFFPNDGHNYGKKSVAGKKLLLQQLVLNPCFSYRVSTDSQKAFLLLYDSINVPVLRLDYFI